MADWNGFKKNGTPYIPNDATARAGVIANTKLIKDTVGFIGKNKCPRFSNYSQANVVFTVDSDGVVDITTSAAASANVWNVIDSGLPVLENGKKYKVSGLGTSTNQDGYVVGDNNGADYVYVHDEGNGGEFTYDSSKPLKKIQIGLRSGQTASHTKLSPMIYDADILDPTYEPHFGSTAFPRSEQAVLGAKNRNPMTLANLKKWNTSGTWSGNVFTHNNGPTYTVATDSDGNVTGITVNGNPSQVTTFTVGQITGLGDKWILNGITGGATGTYGVQLYDITTSTWLTQYAVDGDSEITLDASHAYNLVFFIRINVSISNLLIKPMLRLATDTDDTYAPYAMTNMELTEKVQSIKTVGTLVANSSLNDYYKTGDYYSNTGSNTATLTDKPSDLTSAFRMSVICGNYPIGEGNNLTSTPITQKIELVNGATTPVIYMRHKTGGSDTYGSWYKFTGTVVS